MDSRWSFPNDGQGIMGLWLLRWEWSMEKYRIDGSNIKYNNIRLHSLTKVRCIRGYW